MAKQLQSNPEMKEAFKNYVDAIGGKNCTAWSQVAHYMKTQWNFDAHNKPQILERLYDMFFTQQDPLSVNDISHIYKFQIDNDFTSLALDIVCKKYNMAKYKMRRYLVQSFRKGLSIFITALSWKKTQDQKKTRNELYKSITIFLNMYKAQENEKIIQDIRESAIIFRQLYHVLADNLEYVNRQQYKLYESLASVCSRHSFKKILYYLDYIHNLKKIYGNKLKDMTIHPELHPIIFENTQTTLYKKYIDVRDDEQKFQLFNQALVDTQQLQEIYFQEDKKIFKNTVDKFQEKKKPRPRFGISKQVYGKNYRTVIFGDEADHIEELHPIEQVVNKNEVVNNLYNLLYQEAFQYDIEFEKHRRKQKQQ